ncbi:MAG: hypothetical protein BWY76_00286 [bacterium ADurb.Bin429]|nr:MAG: hypothetical protein BWY76_00286 [bacterium ADurb.Bin429]
METMNDQHAANITGAADAATLSAQHESPTPLITLRATDGIWDNPDTETPPKAGEVRPFPVIDEQIIHLEGVQGVINREELQQLLQAEVTARDLPALVEPCEARWCSWPAADHTRPRVMLSFPSFPFYTYHLLFGIDQHGTSASLTMLECLQLSTKPVIPTQPEPKPPREVEIPESNRNGALAGIIISSLIGLIAFVTALNGSDDTSTIVNWVFTILAAIIAIACAIWYVRQGSQQQAEIEAYKAAAHRQHEEHARAVSHYQQQQEKAERDMQAWQHSEQEVGRCYARRGFVTEDLYLFQSVAIRIFHAVAEKLTERGATILHRQGSSRQPNSTPWPSSQHEMVPTERGTRISDILARLAKVIRP